MLLFLVLDYRHGLNVVHKVWCSLTININVFLIIIKHWYTAMIIKATKYASMQDKIYVYKVVAILKKCRKKILMWLTIEY